ncbi:2279_t:CDS:2, partial [Entrophospora sp. SA101]
AQYRKILVENRIKEYENAKEENVKIKEVDILDAINFKNKNPT